MPIAAPAVNNQAREMTQEYVTELCRAAVMLSLLISTPILSVAVLVGLSISILQAVTQIQDQTVSVIPKIVVMLLTMVYVLPWMLNMMVDYATELYLHIPDML